MEENLESTSNENELRLENQFLKMKMMLEHGAEFGSSKDLPPSIENDFLRSVMEFEKQWETGERVKVFDKLGRPIQFKPVNQIADEQIDNEWAILYEFMQSKGIELDACSPNVTARELYRFTLEELFNYETDNINMPGMMTCFIYDEFHPDAEYENSQKAVDYAIDYVFGKTSFYDHHFAESISFNQHKNLSKMEFNNVVENLKNHYEEITLGHTKATGCTINEMHCAVHGYYEAAITIGGKSRLKKGHWSVSFQLDQESGYWDINDVQIRGVEIP